MTVHENLLLAKSLCRGRNRDVADLRPLDVFELFPELHRWRRMPAHALSGGQRQMLAISLLFVQQPRVLLLDEPIEGLSQDKASDILHGIETYVSGTDATVLLVEHNTTFVLQFRSAISFMSNGTITQTLEATAPDTESRLVDLFLGA